MLTFDLSVENKFWKSKKIEISFSNMLLKSGLFYFGEGLESVNNENLEPSLICNKNSESNYPLVESGFSAYSLSKKYEVLTWLEGKKSFFGAKDDSYKIYFWGLERRTVCILLNWEEFSAEEVSEIYIELQRLAEILSAENYKSPLSSVGKSFKRFIMFAIPYLNAILSIKSIEHFRTQPSLKELAINLISLYQGTGKEQPYGLWTALFLDTTYDNAAGAINQELLNTLLSTSKKSLLPLEQNDYTEVPLCSPSFKMPSGQLISKIKLGEKSKYSTEFLRSTITPDLVSFKLIKDLFSTHNEDLLSFSFSDEEEEFQTASVLADEIAQKDSQTNPLSGAPLQILSESDIQSTADSIASNFSESEIIKSITEDIPDPLEILIKSEAASKNDSVDNKADYLSNEISMPNIDFMKIWNLSIEESFIVRLICTKPVLSVEEFKSLCLILSPQTPSELLLSKIVGIINTVSDTPVLQDESIIVFPAEALMKAL